MEYITQGTRIKMDKNFNNFILILLGVTVCISAGMSVSALYGLTSGSVFILSATLIGIAELTKPVFLYLSRLFWPENLIKSVSSFTVAMIIVGISTFATVNNMNIQMIQEPSSIVLESYQAELESNTKAAENLGTISASASRNDELRELIAIEQQNLKQEAKTENAFKRTFIAGIAVLVELITIVLSMALGYSAKTSKPKQESLEDIEKTLDFFEGKKSSVKKVPVKPINQKTDKPQPTIREIKEQYKCGYAKAKKILAEM